MPRLLAAIWAALDALAAGDVWLATDILLAAAEEGAAAAGILLGTSGTLRSRSAASGPTRPGVGVTSGWACRRLPGDASTEV